MSREEFLCARCARYMKTCCQTAEVHATVGDVKRISQFSGQTDFTEYRIPENQEYIDQSHDSAWAKHVFRSDGSRRILKRQPNGDCTFLGDSGCTLPLETRPLVCRLYPFNYTDQGIADDLATGCPLELLTPGKGLIEELDMKRADAQRWHRQLYEEIRTVSEMNDGGLMIGLTYDLRDQYLAEGYTEMETAEFDRADTIDEIENAIQSLGHKTDRIGNAKELLHRLADGDRWDLVFNICEGLRGTGRESQVPAMLDMYEIPYTFADPCVMSVCLDKAVTKCVVANAGLPTPKHSVVRDTVDVANLPESNRLRFPLFAKPIAEGTGKGVTPASLVNDIDELTKICSELLDEFKQPVLVEEFLPGRELTVGLIGTGPDAYCLGTLEIHLLENAEADVYSYVNKEYCEELVKYVRVNSDDDEQVRRAEEIALAAWRALGCRDGGRIDIRCDAEGEPQFLEANPLAGLHPFHSDLPMLATALGIPYVELIRRIVDSAVTRCGKLSFVHRIDAAENINGKHSSNRKPKIVGESSR